MKYLNNVVEQLKDRLYKCFSSETGGHHFEYWKGSLKDGSLILSMTKLPKTTVLLEENLRELSKMKSAQWSDRSLLQWHFCHCWKFLVNLICWYIYKDLAVPEKWVESGPHTVHYQFWASPSAFLHYYNPLSKQTAWWPTKSLPLTGDEPGTKT